MKYLLGIALVIWASCSFSKQWKNYEDKYDFRLEPKTKRIFYFSDPSQKFDSIFLDSISKSILMEFNPNTFNIPEGSQLTPIYPLRIE